MKRKGDKLAHAAHVKRHTVGTSNEISFSVLDAARDALDERGRTDREARLHRFGGISLFTLSARRKKPAGTPTKEQGLPLSTGDFASVEPPKSQVPQIAYPSETPSSAPSAPSSSVRSAATRPMSSEEASEKPIAQPAEKPPLSPEEEIARRKARRRLSKLVAVAAIALITGVVAVAGGGYLYHDYQQYQDGIMSLNDTLKLVAETDEAIKGLDDFVSDPFSSGSRAACEDLRSSLPEIEEKLAQADERARALSVSLRESQGKEAAHQAVATISARNTLVDQGYQIIDAADRAYGAIDQARKAWDVLLSADALARESSELVKDTTPENVQTSIAKANESFETFEEAEASFAEARSLYPAADFAAFSDYIAKRKEALGHALASDEAILAKDKDAATEHNDAYNAADAEAAERAKGLPDDPSSPVVDAFEAEVEECEKAYSTARLQAGAADAFIRDYLGTEIK